MTAPKRPPAPTIPKCQGANCDRPGPLFQGLCHRCTAAEERGHQ